MGSCFDCSSKDKEELISDFLINIPIRTVRPESYIKEIENILSESKTVNQGKDIKEFKEYLLVKLFTKFLLIKSNENASRIFFSEIKTKIKEIEKEGDSNAILYLLLSILFLINKNYQISCFDLFSNMKAIAKVFYEKMEYSEVNLINETFQIKGETNLFIRLLIFKRIVSFYIDFCSVCVIKSVSPMSGSISEFENYWNDVFSTERRNDLFKSLFINHEGKLLIDFMLFDSNNIIKFHVETEIREELKRHYLNNKSESDNNKNKKKYEHLVKDS